MYARRELPPRERQLVTLGVLAALGGCESELEAHLNAALNVGLAATWADRPDAGAAARRCARSGVGVSSGFHRVPPGSACSPGLSGDSAGPGVAGARSAGSGRCGR
ncbi:hypothetical protein GTY73_06790 [Streptomyces sp. SID8354]|nr:hypothetical protein [Streptomyces sp. SID8354]